MLRIGGIIHSLNKPVESYLGQSMIYLIIQKALHQIKNAVFQEWLLLLLLFFFFKAWKAHLNAVCSAVASVGFLAVCRESF